MDDFKMCATYDVTRTKRTEFDDYNLILDLIRTSVRGTYIKPSLECTEFNQILPTKKLREKSKYFEVKR